MPFPRLVDFTHELLAALDLDYAQPAAGSISAKLWAACQDLTNDALKSDFMQGLGKGTLSPDNYGQYTIQDCAYCVDAADDYKTMADWTTSSIPGLPPTRTNTNGTQPCSRCRAA